MTEIIGIAGIGFSVFAIWRQWNLHHRCSHLEERLKDERITSEQMTRSMNWARIAPIVYTLIGACLLIWSASRFIS